MRLMSLLVLGLAFQHSAEANSVWIKFVAGCTIKTVVVRLDTKELHVNYAKETYNGVVARICIEDGYVCKEFALGASGRSVVAGEPAYRLAESFVIEYSLGRDEECKGPYPATRL